MIDEYVTKLEQAGFSAKQIDFIINLMLDYAVVIVTRKEINDAK